MVFKRQRVIGDKRGDSTEAATITEGGRMESQGWDELNGVKQEAGFGDNTHIHYRHTNTHTQTMQCARSLAACCL